MDDRPELRYLRYVKEKVCASGPEVWFDLGTELLDQKYVADLNAIKYDVAKRATNERCSDMFNVWLERQPKASWRRLITAMKKISMNSLASDVEKMLISEEVATVDQQVMQEGQCNLLKTCRLLMLTTDSYSYKQWMSSWLFLLSKIKLLL